MGSYILFHFVPAISLFSHEYEVKLLTYHFHLYPIFTDFLFILVWKSTKLQQYIANQKEASYSFFVYRHTKLFKTHIIFTYHYYTKMLNRHVLVCCNLCNTEQIISMYILHKILNKYYCFQVLYKYCGNKILSFSVSFKNSSPWFLFCHLSGCHTLHYLLSSWISAVVIANILNQHPELIASE